MDCCGCIVRIRHGPDQGLCDNAQHWYHHFNVHRNLGRSWHHLPDLWSRKCRQNCYLTEGKPHAISKQKNPY